MKAQGHFIAGLWQAGKGPVFESHNPATGAIHWQGQEALGTEVDAAIQAARKAFPAWSRLSVTERAGYLKAFAGKVQEHRADLSEAISQETGKPLWESLQEVDTMIAKVANSLDAYQERCEEVESAQAGFTAFKRFRPHGVVGVLGPFNLPGHLPHSHIVPALLAGNTVVYKPSEMTPSVGQKTTILWEAAGLPSGVLNLVQGGRNSGVSLANHLGLDGLFFTGSHAGGLALSRLYADRPGKILALELGGNNPLIIWDCSESAAAALITVQSAFITSGQRCVCARRLILPKGKSGDLYLEALLALLPRIRVGAYSDTPEPFMGPVISATAAVRLLESQAGLVKNGGKLLVGMEQKSPALLTPGIVDMTSAKIRMDEEYFGPLLQIIRVPDFDSALEEANRTRFGLAAGLLSDSREHWETFRTQIRAGVVNWNRPTTGASGKLPFGGVGESGNHRPSAYYAADYCAYPMASIEANKVLAVDASILGQMPKGIEP
jgi:succinylglutamic semialdehyde dehydrogenase